MSHRSRARHLILPLAVVLALSVGGSARGADLSVYRGFRLGMSLSDAATLAAVPVADARTIVDRPALIQELIWRPPSRLVTDAVPDRDSVAQILFGFWNGGLYRIVVGYEPDLTEGMTDADMIEALSPAYGASSTPAAGAVVITSTASQGYNDTQPVVARWEDRMASVSLYHGTYRLAYGLVISSKTLAPMARAGLITGLRMAALDAPRRELAEQQQRDEAERAQHALARMANKTRFRY